MKLILLLLAIGLAAAAPACLKYMDGKQMKEDVCLKKGDQADIVLVKACDPPKYCPGNENNIPNACAEPLKLRPGELCKGGTECYSGKCTEQHKCQGSKLNEECKELGDCDPGLICVKEKPADEKSKCLVAKKFEEACQTFLDCAAPFRCVGGKCAKPGSVDDDVKETDHVACKNYYLVTKKVDNVDVQFCGKGPKLKDPPGSLKEPPKCENHDGCKYENQAIADGCQCGRTQTGQKYCKVYAGDFDLKEVSSSL